MAEQKGKSADNIESHFKGARGKEGSLLKGLGIAYWEWRPNVGYFHSPEYEKYAISEMPNELIWDKDAPFAYVHPDDVPLMKAFMQQYPDDKIQKSAVVRCKMRDSSYQWTEMFSFAETDKDGQTIRLVSAMRDVDKEWIASRTAEQKNIELSRIIDAISGGIATYRVGDMVQVVSLSHGMEQRLGYTKEQLAQITHQDALMFVHPSDRTLLKKAIDKVIKSGKQQTLAYQILKSDKTYKWFRATIYPAGEADGYQMLYEVLTDIAEENADYEEALNEMNEMVLIGDWESRDILYLNQAAAAAGGQNTKDMLGRKCSQVAQHCDNMCSYCFKKELSYDKLDSRIMKVGKKYFQTKGKRILWNGREAFVEYVSDVTAQQNMTEKAVFERNLITAATRSFFQLCILSNLTQNTYSIIEYENFNTKKANADGVFDDLIKVGASTVPDEDREAFVNAFSRQSLMKAHADGIKIVPLTHRQLGDDGKMHWNHTTVIFADQLFNDDLYSITFTCNVDVQKKNEATVRAALSEAEHANAAKTAFLSRVSHDMRTPLNGILGLTTILKDYVTDDNVRRDLTELELSGKYLLNLINDTLDVSRIENGKLELKPAVCDGRDLFNNAFRLIKTNADTKNIQLNIKADNIPFSMLYVDSGRIEQVILNVVGNAIKFSPQNGHIDLTLQNLSVENGVITDTLTVRDYGCGMSKEFLPHIFEAFSQEDTARTSSNQGTGLGMAITKQLIKLMGGDINVESELGKGSTFTITLRLNVATDEQIKAWERDKIVVDETAGLCDKRILLCEDHPLNTKIATRLLELKGMIVEHAENGKIAVDMFAKSALDYYDAILMDIRMPVMDGIDAAKTIRALERRDAINIPIVAMTANAFADDVEQTREAGMNAHLSKPIEPPILYKTLVELLKVEHKVTKQKVLIVDDVEINRAVIRASIDKYYDIIEAENGVQAMHIVETTRGVDAVITDIQMPEMDGVELIKRIRSDNRYRHIAIIANTEFGDRKQEENLLELGANDFIYKPTTPKIVALRVRNALKKD